MSGVSITWRMAPRHRCGYTHPFLLPLMVQVVKSELFDHNLVALFAAVNRRWGVGLAQ